MIEEELNRLFSPEWLRKTANQTGFVKRERKIDPALMFWSLTLGFGVQIQRTLASLRRLYEEKGKVHISRSSFYDRFTPELVRFLHACVLHGLEDITQEPNRMLKDKLAGFEDIVTQDSTVIRLHKKLAKKWPATRTKKIGSSLFHVGRLNLSFPNLRYIVVTKFFVVLKPLAASFADWIRLFIPSKIPLSILVFI